MKMFIGGACQGKTAYARKKLEEGRWIDGRECGIAEIFEADGLHHLHSLIRRMLEEGEKLEILTEELLKRNPSIYLVCDEVGSGIVPIDAFERRYREAVGRTCTKLASQAEEVTRILCGLGQVIKP